MTSTPTTAAAAVASAPRVIPANIDLEDRVVGPLTARQTVILGVSAAALYTAWTALAVPVLVFLACCIPVTALAVVVAFGRRDGMLMDRWLLGALAHYAHTRPARAGVDPDAPGWLTANARPRPGSAGPRRPRTPVQLPPRAVHGIRPATAIATAIAPGGPADTWDGGHGTAGVIDLGPDGLVVCAVATPTGAFGLRSPAEQEAMVVTFAAYLHSLTEPIQILVRAVPLDVADAIAHLHAIAPHLDHPALSAAAIDHADYLAALADHHELLRRQVLVVLREPTPTPPTRQPGSHRRRHPNRHGQHGQHGQRGRHHGRHGGQPGVGGRADGAELRLARRLAEAVELLAPAGIVVTPLDPARTAAVLSAACHPGRLLPAADPDQITTGPDNAVTAAPAGGVW